MDQHLLVLRRGHGSPAGRSVPWGVQERASASDTQGGAPAAASWDSWVCDSQRDKRGCGSPTPKPGSREQRETPPPQPGPDAMRGVVGPPQAGLAILSRVMARNGPEGRHPTGPAPLGAAWLGSVPCEGVGGEQGRALCPGCRGTQSPGRSRTSGQGLGIGVYKLCRTLVHRIPRGTGCERCGLGVDGPRGRGGHGAEKPPPLRRLGRALREELQ